MTTVHFIFGAQRSGTNALLRGLGQCHNIHAYPERQNPYTDNIGNGLKLNPLADVKAALDADPHDTVVLKPLVESHRAREILEYFPESRAIWAFRYYGDVIHSMVTRWPTISAETHLAPMLRKYSGSSVGHRDAYSIAMISFVEQVYAAKPTQLEAAATWWVVRNSTLFDQGLHRDDRCLVLSYETLVSAFERARSAFAFFGATATRQQWERSFTSASVRKHPELIVKPSIQVELDRVYGSLMGAQSL